MQTLTVDIQDNFVEDFLSMIEQYKDKVQVKKDKNLEQDPYFYERQKELHTIRQDIQSGDRTLTSFEDFENSTIQFEKELELKYAN